MKKRYRKFSEKGRCRFCRSGELEVDYKDVATLQKLCTTQGKLFSRKRSGNCAKHQRHLTRAIKRARVVSIMPFTASSV